jgi:hypothetical protein
MPSKIEISSTIFTLINQIRQHLEEKTGKNWSIQEVIGISLLEMDYEINKKKGKLKDIDRDEYFQERLVPLFSKAQIEYSPAEIDKKIEQDVMYR